MTTSSALAFSDVLAEAVDAAAIAVVQVQGRRRPASGLVYADEVVLTMARTLGRGDDLHVRRHDGQAFDAQLAGWDPATGLAVLRVAALGVAPVTVAQSPPRVGQLALAIARSWSNAVTATVGLVSVIGGPLRTGRGRAIDQVLRTSAPMHDGFAGGALIDAAGSLVGVATAAEIRGLSVVIPASIAWKAAATVLEHGGMKRGYLGIAGQPVRLAERQRAAARGAGSADPEIRPAEDALLVVAVTDGSPAASAGLLVGDVLTALNGRTVASPEDLLDLLAEERPGNAVTVQVLRGDQPIEIAATVGERPAH